MSHTQIILEIIVHIGLTRQTVIAIEKNRYSPSLEAAFKITEVFGVALDEVFQYRTSK